MVNWGDRNTGRTFGGKFACINMFSQRFFGFHSFRRKDDGVVAVEFALLALPLFTLILGIIEFSLFFATGIALEGAAAEAGRAIRIGQVQVAANPEEAFEEELCDAASLMIDCDLLQYEVIRIEDDTFQGAEDTPPPQFDEDGNFLGSGFAPGNSNDVIMVRVAQRYDFLMPFIGTMISGDISRNWATHIATVVIKSEPFNFGED